MSEAKPKGGSAAHHYSTGNWCARLIGVAWKYRGDCVVPVVLSLVLLLLGLAGLQFLGIVIDVIRYALDPTQRAPSIPSAGPRLRPGPQCRSSRRWRLGS